MTARKITVRLVLTRSFRVRLWLARRLVDVACWLLSFGSVAKVQ